MDYSQFPAVAAPYHMVAQLGVQAAAVLLTVVWSGAVSWALFASLDALWGLRPSSDDERQGLDQTAHGESAYNL